MNLQQLRYVVATAEHGTMTAAADALHVAQSALSRAIRALEREIGVVVFARDGRGIRLTAEGRSVLERAHRILDQVDQLAALGSAGPTLRLVAITGQARELGSTAVAAHVTGHGPETARSVHAIGPHEGGSRARNRVQLVVVDSRDEVFTAVRDGAGDLGLVDLPGPADLVARSLGWQELVLVHPPGWDLPNPLPVGRLAELPLLSAPSDDWRRAALEQGLGAVGVTPQVAAETGDRDLVRMLVVDGAGAAFSYGRQAAAARAAGAGSVSLSPKVLRHVGVVSLREPTGPAAALVADLAEAATDLLIPDEAAAVMVAIRVAGPVVIQPPDRPTASAAPAL